MRSARLAERKLRQAGPRCCPASRARTSSLTADKHRQIAEVSVHSPHLDLAAPRSRATTAALSVADVIDKLLRQAQRHVGERRERKRRGSPRAAAARARAAAERADRGAAPRVIRSRRFRGEADDRRRGRARGGGRRGGLPRLPRRSHRARERALPAQGRQPGPDRARGLMSALAGPAATRCGRVARPWRGQRRRASRVRGRCSSRGETPRPGPDPGRGRAAASTIGSSSPGCSGRASPSPATPTTSATAACRSSGAARSATCAS